MKRVLNIYAEKDSTRDIAHIIAHHVPYRRRRETRDAFDKMPPSERKSLKKYRVSIEVKEA
jgi:hypothetical protein